MMNNVIKQNTQLQILVFSQKLSGMLESKSISSDERGNVTTRRSEFGTAGRRLNFTDAAPI